LWSEVAVEPMIVRFSTSSSEISDDWVSGMEGFEVSAFLSGDPEGLWC
jgi:hypothetical protein